MQGIGNDYIYFDCMQEPIENPSELAIRLSDRHFGIGGDGIILRCALPMWLTAALRMFNLDGSEGKNVRQRHTLRGQTCARSGLRFGRQLNR